MESDFEPTQPIPRPPEQRRSLDYGSLFSRSWRITWNHRILWIFGILLALFGGRGGGGGPNFSFGGGDRGANGLEGGIGNALRNVDPGLILAIAAVVLAVVILLVVIGLVVGTWAKGSLISGINTADDRLPVTFSASARVGWQRFWPELGILLLFAIVTALLVVLLVSAVAVPIILAFAVFNAPLVGIPLAIVLGLVGIGLFFVVIIGSSILLSLAEVHCIVAVEGVSDSIRAAWRIFKTYLWPTALLWLIQFGLGCGFSLLAVLVLLPVIILAAIGFVANPVLGFVLLIPLLLVGLVLLFVSGVFHTFLQALWTVAYRDLEGIASSESQPEASA